MNTSLRHAPHGMVAVVAALSAIVMVAGVAAIVAEDESLPTAGARVRLAGEAFVEDVDGSRRSLDDGDIVGPGDIVEVTGGTAVLELADGGTVEGREGRDTVDDSRLEVGAPVRLLAGDALVAGPAGVAVEAAGTIVTLRSANDSAARIRRELAVTTATYEGSTAVDSAGQRRAVPALRQLGVASVGRPPTEAAPLRFDDSDPWDLRYLGGAIALTRSLDALSVTFTAQGVARTSASDYEALLPKLADEPTFDSNDLDRSRPAGETLVGAAIAALGERTSFDRRWDEVFDFRDQGAAWGLVAFDQGVDDGPVLADVDRALALSVQLVPPEEVAAPPPTAPPATVPPSPTTAPPATSGPSTTEPNSPAPTTPTTPPPPTNPLDPPPTLPDVNPENPVPDTGSGILDGLLQPVNDLLGGLLG